MSARFPSPYGEVGFDLVKESAHKYADIPGFPSPYGEVGFDQGTGKNTVKVDAGFRPLTGKLVLIRIFIVIASFLHSRLFPSPYGEVGFDPCRPESLFSATHSGFCGADDEIRHFSVLIGDLDAAEPLLYKARCGFWINAAWTIFIK